MELHASLACQSQMPERGVDIASFRSIKFPVQIVCIDIVAATILIKDTDQLKLKNIRPLGTSPNALEWGSRDYARPTLRCPFKVPFASLGIILHEWVL